MAKKRRDLYYQLPKNLDLEELTDEEAGQIWKALNRYDGERVKMPTAAMRLIYKQCVDHIDTENERYDEYCEKRRENIKKRYDKKQESTSVDNCIQVNTHNQNHNTESESESECKSESESEATYGGGYNRRTAATAAEAAEVQDRFIDEVITSPQRIAQLSEAVGGWSETEILAEVLRFKGTLASNGDLTIDENELRRCLTAWVRKGKDKKLKNKNNADDKRHSNFDAIAATTAAMWAGVATPRENQGEVSDPLPF